jgi:3-hydroxybutyryl-CoA dehydrogenase
MPFGGESIEMTFETVGVLGAGNIGIGVVTDLVMHGITAVVIDISKDQLLKARGEVLNNVRVAPLVSKTLPRVTKDQAMKRMILSDDLEAVASCSFIIENVTEDWNVKRPVYEKLDRVTSSDVCFAANTSCISITKISSATNRPANIIGVHFMNPVHLKPTVEVIRGFHTSDQAVETVLQLTAILNKEAIVVEDFPGFVSNRISHVFMNEAAFALQDGVASAQNIDMIFRKCFGHKMGPLETADLIGLDTVMRSLDVLYESYQDAKYRCCPLLRELVQAGNLGRKTGKGFHDYPNA